MKLILALLLSVVCPLAETLCAEPEAASTGITAIPNLKLRVDSIKRINENHVVFVIKAEVEAGATAAVHLETPGVKPPPNATKQDIASGKYGATAFSLMGAEMFDEDSGKKYPAIVPTQSIPFFGPSSAKIILDPGSSFQMSICFHAPPPYKPDENGAVPDQKVTLLFANAIKPLKGLVLPPDKTPKAPKTNP